MQGTAVLLRYSSTAREEKVPATVSAERVCIPGALHCSMSNCCFLTYIQVLRRQVRWSLFSSLLRIFHSLLWSPQSKSMKQKLEKEMATHSSMLARRISQTEEPDGPWDHKELDTTEAA